MIVSIHTVSSLCSYLLFSALLGLITNVIFTFIALLPAMLKSMFACVMISFKDMKTVFYTYRGSSIFCYISEVLCIICLACMILISSFLFNTGHIRPSAIALFLIGFICAGKLFSNAVKAVSFWLIFFCKRTLDILLYPIFTVFKVIFKLFSLFFRSVENRVNKKIAYKYERRIFSEAQMISLHGLLNIYRN